jgi:hypothetical protein
MDIDFIRKQIDKKIESCNIENNENSDNKLLLKDLFSIILNYNKENLEKLQNIVNQNIYSFFNYEMPIIKQILIGNDELNKPEGFYLMDDEIKLPTWNIYTDYFESNFNNENQFTFDIAEFFIFDERKLKELNKKIKIVINNNTNCEFEFVKNDKYNQIARAFLEVISNNNIELNYPFLPYNNSSFSLRLKLKDVLETRTKINIKIYNDKDLFNDIDFNKKLYWNIEKGEINKAAVEKLIDAKKVFEYTVACNDLQIILATTKIIESLKIKDAMVFRTKDYLRGFSYYKVNINDSIPVLSNKVLDKTLYPKGAIKTIGEIKNILKSYEVTKDLEIADVIPTGRFDLKQVVDDLGFENKKYLKKEILELKIKAPKKLEFIVERVNFIANIIDNKIGDYWIKPEILREK